MDTLSNEMLLCILLGFFIAAVISLHDGKKRAHKNWKSSTIAGLIISAAFPYGIVAIAVGAFFGYAGWKMFCDFFPLTE